ncbi:hypothetical protein [Nocardia jiangxiensis]|uniref:Uncharacterized protein n=1 Tax=Nocardia jiangxiensis TaxID=282685 RepID=A0ABW6S5A6_9NOCA|nr:hypothetical protein [Nocardia jiangxiensis]
MSTSPDPVDAEQSTEYVLRFTVPAAMTEEFAPAFGQLIGAIEPVLGAITERGGEVGLTRNGVDISDVL